MRTFPERETMREIANTTIQHMNLLKQALDAADFHEARFNEMRAIAEKNSADLGFAKERLQQDEATINLKDLEIQGLVDRVGVLSKENERLNESVITCENKVEVIEEELQSYRDKIVETEVTA